MNFITQISNFPKVPAHIRVALQREALLVASHEFAPAQHIRMQMSGAELRTNRNVLRGIVMDVEARNYPVNCWWVAARPEEITSKPFQRWLLDTPVVLFRTEDGRPVALDDRCPHRWSPLSEGYVEGDNIVCPYHGARFAADGHCPKFPGQDRVTNKMRVRSFALVERGPFVWIWMGDEAAREATPLPPDHSWSRDSELVHHHRRL